MIKSFKYKNSKGEIKDYIIGVLSETPDYMMGIDINSLLNTIEDSIIRENTKNKIYKILENSSVSFYNNLKESRFSEKKPIKGFESDWMKFFKNFKKINLIKN